MSTSMQPKWVAIGFLLSFPIFLCCFLIILIYCRQIKISRLLQRASSLDLKFFTPMDREAKKALSSFLFKLDNGDPDNDQPLPLQIIGQGGCGEVYKAELSINPSKRLAFAIKKINQPALGEAQLCDEESHRLNNKLRQIRSEIKTVGRVRHPNLLPLLAHISKPDDRHYLVYEFMRYGSLQDAIRGAGRGGRRLPWQARYKIALGVAQGLEYLHLVHRPSIIHRDLKPANILLDDDLNARISDFGLAKFVPDTVSGTLKSRVAGTIGYIAPEYVQTLQFTVKSDVYGFGVILAVLVTGKFPTDRFFQETDEMCMMPWIRNLINSGDRMAAIDRTLMGNGFEEQMLLVLKIACFCSYDNPDERPNSRDIRIMLSQIKKSLEIRIETS